jgi:hypothetical protein
MVRAADHAVNARDLPGRFTATTRTGGLPDVVTRLWESPVRDGPHEDTAHCSAYEVIAGRSISAGYDSDSVSQAHCSLSSAYRRRTAACRRRAASWGRRHAHPADFTRLTADSSVPRPGPEDVSVCCWGRPATRTARDHARTARETTRTAHDLALRPSVGRAFAAPSTSRRQPRFGREASQDSVPVARRGPRRMSDSVDSVFVSSSP